MEMNALEFFFSCPSDNDRILSVKKPTQELKQLCHKAPIVTFS